MDDFYTKEKCDRCGGSLAGGRIMSMFNEECICMECKRKEAARPDYAEAVKKDILAYKGKQRFICCICGKESSGYGNNPVPIAYNGRCCDTCNIKVVIPRRFKDKDVIKILDDFSESLL